MPLVFVEAEVTYTINRRIKLREDRCGARKQVFCHRFAVPRWDGPRPPSYVLTGLLTGSNHCYDEELAASLLGLSVVFAAKVVPRVQNDVSPIRDREITMTNTRGHGAFAVRDVGSFPGSCGLTRPPRSSIRARNRSLGQGHARKRMFVIRISSEMPICREVSNFCKVMYVWKPDYHVIYSLHAPEYLGHPS